MLDIFQTHADANSAKATLDFARDSSKLLEMNNFLETAQVSSWDPVGNDSQEVIIPYGTPRRKLQNAIGEKHGRKD
jgi:hypothetical protein